MSKPISKRPIAVLELHAIQWRGLAGELQGKLQGYVANSIEADTIRQHICASLMNAAECEAEVVKRRSRRLSPPAPSLPLNIVRGPWRQA